MSRSGDEPTRGALGVCRDCRTTRIPLLLAKARDSAFYETRCPGCWLRYGRELKKREALVR